MIDYANFNKAHEAINKLYGVFNIVCRTEDICRDSYGIGDPVVILEMPLTGYIKMAKDIIDLAQYMDNEEKVEIKLTFDEAMSFENLEERQ